MTTKNSFNVIKLVKETELSKILKYHKKTESPVDFLFVSLWDDNSNKIMKILEENHSETSNPIYVVDSYNMPHSFVIYNTFKVPAIVKARIDRVKVDGREEIKNNTEVIDYLPHIYEFLESN